MSPPSPPPPLRFALPCFLLAFLLAAAEADDSCPAALPHQTPAPRSISPASVASYMVSLVVPAQQRLFQDGTVINEPTSFHCTAILLSPRWAAVPSSCYDPDFGIVAHVAASARFAGQRIAIESWLPADMIETDHHLVLVKLAADAPENATFAFVNNNPALPEPRSYVQAISYGIPKVGDDVEIMNMLPLRQVEARVVDTSLCPDELGEDNPVCNEQICAGWAVSGAGCNACVMGDDQALLSFDEEGNAIVLGMGAEDGGRCGEAGLVTKFVRAERYVGWMIEQGVEFTVSSSAQSVFERPGELGTGGENDGATSVNGADGETVVEGKDKGGGVSLGAAIGAPVALFVTILVVAVIIVVVRRR